MSGEISLDVEEERRALMVTVGKHEDGRRVGE